MLILLDMDDLLFTNRFSRSGFHDQVFTIG
jgi:hypothetical protein